MSKQYLGKYEILGRLGRGGMAEVYRGYHPALDRYVAIKLLHPFLADDPEFKERFEREARNIARLRHPNIVQVFDFDFDEQGESYYMVMELINGPTLKDRLYNVATGSESLTIQRAIEIVKEAAQALSYAHKRGMIHRDVKPANLMIDTQDEERIVLTDFGIAKIMSGGQFTASGGMVGTPAYMSPEQGLGEAGDDRSDLYSIGIIMFQMLTGKLPFDADTPLGIILKHLNDPVPPPRSINPDIPEWLEQVILKVMAKDPEARYQTADELVAALDAGLQGTPQAVDLDAIRRSSILVQTSIPDATPPYPNYATITSNTGIGLDTLPPRQSSYSLLVTSGLIIIGFIVLFLLLLGQGGQGPMAGFFEVADEPTPIPSETLLPPSDTPTPTITLTHTPTDTPTQTDTFTPTATDTPTATNTFTPTATETLTPTDTVTPSQTPSPTENFTATAEYYATTTATLMTATAQAQADFFSTQRAITPTVDIQRVLEDCDLEYAVAAPLDVSIAPASNELRNSRLVPNQARWTLELTIRNVSTCDLPAGFVYLSFVRDADTDISEYDNNCATLAADRIVTNHNLTDPEIANFRITEAVPQGETVTITLEGRAPDRFGCYFGTWELRIPDYDLFVGDPFVIAYRVYSGR